MALFRRQVTLAEDNTGSVYSFNPENRTVICNLIRVDEPTINGRIYPKELMQKVIAEFNERKSPMFGETFLGSSDYQINTEINLYQASHQMKEFSIVPELRQVSCLVQILDTSAGHKLFDLLSKEGVVPSMSGIGSTNKDNVIQDDYTFVSVSFVSKHP